MNDIYRRMAYRNAVRANFDANNACKDEEQQIKTVETPNGETPDYNNDAIKTQQDNQSDIKR